MAEQQTVSVSPEVVIATLKHRIGEEVGQNALLSARVSGLEQQLAQAQQALDQANEQNADKTKARSKKGGDDQ
jgi:hypothetical protein